MTTQTQSRPMVENISCVLPEQNGIGGLFVGNIYGAQNAQILKEYGIRAMITASVETPIDHKPEDIPFHLKFAAHDKEDYYISSHISESISFIEKCRKYTNVYVHCYAGVSRSVALVCAYLMSKYGWNVDKTVKFMISKRVVAKPNDGFMKQLRQYEIQLKGGKSSENRPSQANTITNTDMKSNSVSSPSISHQNSYVTQYQGNSYIPSVNTQSKSSKTSDSSFVNPPRQVYNYQPAKPSLSTMVQAPRISQPLEDYPRAPTQPIFQNSNSFSKAPSKPVQPNIIQNAKIQSQISVTPLQSNGYANMQRTSQSVKNSRHVQNYNHNQIPIPKVLTKKVSDEPQTQHHRNSQISQYSQISYPFGQTPQPKTRRNMFNEYLSPQPVSNTQRIPQAKHSAGKINVMSSYPTTSNTAKQIQIQKSPYYQSNTMKQMNAGYHTLNAGGSQLNSQMKNGDGEKAKTTSRCLIRPKDLPGYNKY